MEVNVVQLSRNRRWTNTQSQILLERINIIQAPQTPHEEWGVLTIDLLCVPHTLLLSLLELLVIFWRYQMLSYFGFAYDGCANFLKYPSLPAYCLGQPLFMVCTIQDLLSELPWGYIYEGLSRKSSDIVSTIRMVCATWM